MINRILHILVLLGVLAGVTATLLLLDQPVQRLKVNSDLSEGEQAQLQTMLAEIPGSGILRFDLTSLRQQLESVGWARDVYVKRVWPDTVEITLTRRQPIARWGDDHYILEGGELVQLPDQYQKLPHLRVALANPEQTLRTYRLVEQLVAGLGLEVDALHQNDYGEWQVVLDNQLTIKLGSARIAERVRRFLVVYEQVLAEKVDQVAYVDVRYANGVAVGYQNSGVLVASSQ